MEKDNLVEEKHTKAKNNSIEHHSTSSEEMAQIASNHLQIENELTKALLLLNPELITPKQALEIIYDLKTKAQGKSY